MEIVDITACIRITKESEMYGIESYIDIGSKVKITVGRRAVTGYLQRLDYGASPNEDDRLVLQLDDGTLCGIKVGYISDIEEL